MLKISEKDKEKLKDQVRREYQLSYNTIVRKRMIFRAQDKLLNWIADQDKIDTKTLYYNLYSKMAIVYSDDITVKWLPRQMSWNMQANNLNKLARFDVDEMDYSILNYETQLNRFMRWVWIKLMIWWDDIKQVPVRQVMDTRTWVPDPRGWFNPKGFRYHWFELSDFRYNLTEDLGFDQEAVSKCFVAESPETILTRTYEQQSAWLFPATESLRTWDEEWDEVAVYYHMTRFNGKPVFTVWGNNIWELIRYEEIKPVYEEEKKSVNNIPLPVTLNYFAPKKWDPYGTSLADLVQTQHRYKNIMANLMFIREKDFMLWDDVLYDTNVIKNKNDLSTPTLSRKFIWADWTMWPINNAVSIIPKNPNSSSPYNFNDYLDRINQLATWMDARQMWIEWGSNITLWEAQQLQANNNVKSLFEIRINNIWEKQFWNLWYRAYRENFDEANSKIIRVSNSLWVQNIEFTKDDILSKSDPDVRIVSKTEISNERAQQIAQLTPLLISIIQDPNKSQISRTMAQRKLLELAWIEEDEQYIYVNPSWEELDARDKLPLLNNNDPDWIPVDPEEVEADQMTYITIFNQALPTPATKAAIQARKDIIIQKGKNQIMQQPWWNMQAQATNMALQNANTQMQKQWAEQTRQNVMQ